MGSIALAALRLALLHRRAGIGHALTEDTGLCPKLNPSGIECLFISRVDRDCQFARSAGGKRHTSGWSRIPCPANAIAQRSTIRMADRHKRFCHVDDILRRLFHVGPHGILDGLRNGLHTLLDTGKTAIVSQRSISCARE